MVLEALQLETSTSNIIRIPQQSPIDVLFAGILGLNAYAFMFIFIVILVGVLIFGRLYWNQRQRGKAEELSKNKVLCEFCAEGSSKTVLCEVFKGQIKTEVAGSRATFGINQYISRKDNNLGDKGVMGEIDFYYWLPDHAFLVSWPEGKDPKQQIRVMKTHYYINDPMPKITYRPQDWTPDVYDRTTSALAKYAQDEKVAQILVSELSGKFAILENIVGMLNKIPLILYGVCGVAVVLLISVYMGWQNMNGISQVVKFLVGTGK